MSTRAVYEFISSDEFAPKKVSVYKHHDGYPQGAVNFIWSAYHDTLPSTKYHSPIRDKLVVGFIKNNAGRGLIQITSGRSAHGDLDYYYEIHDDPDITVKCFERDWDSNYSFKFIWEYPIAEAWQRFTSDGQEHSKKYRLKA